MNNELLKIIQGDCREVLKTLPDESVQCCITSPPYWGLRDYGHADQIGQEKTPDEFVATMVAIFREVRRVLKSNGTCWLNLGDSYASHPGQRKTTDAAGSPKQISNNGSIRSGSRSSAGLKPKDLIGIPWRVALALQADGWYLRQDIIWSKPNPMPESVTDRCTKSHEYIFLMSKASKYFYDAEAIKERCSQSTHARLSQKVQNQIGSTRIPGKTNGNMKAVGRASWNGSKFDSGKTAAHHNGTMQKDRKYDPRLGNKNNASFDAALAIMPEFRNKRTVWTIPTSGIKEAHFSTYPPDLIKPCILAGCPVGGTVLDPFGGSGTTGQVALELGRKAILIELNQAYIKMIEDRTNVTPGLNI